MTAPAAEGASRTEAVKAMFFDLRTIRRSVLAASACALLAACAADDNDRAALDPAPQAAPTPRVESQPLGAPDGLSAAPAPGQSATIGQGTVKVALILPENSSGNARAAAASMKNAAELALAEFNTSDIQLIVKDDGGSAQGAKAAAQSAADEGAKLILGPLFAHSVASAAQVSKQRNVPMVAFSTDQSVASSGVYLLSFMPESDAERIVSYAVSQGKRSFAALLPETGYGSVVEAAFQQAVAKAGGRVVGLERYSLDKTKMAEAASRLAAALPQADALLIPDTAENVQTLVGLLATNGVNLKKLQLLGTGLWDGPAIARDASMSGAWYAAPDDSGYRAFAQRYRDKYGVDPVRTASLAYDATALVASLVKSRGPDALGPDVFTDPSGFSGVDGSFRFGRDGANQRALAVYKVQAGGATMISPPPKNFDDQTAQAAPPKAE
ncbi:penicillin-binding protein activator [Methylopila sp. M107]|uniref:penicillin-binding protein activator n=1 Tax=Methylopila sp. M107 TaxID=1101190 RepID=UPI00035EE303|nr:penicillin-binding protein activator [Methylopila sp. M107]